MKNILITTEEFMIEDFPEDFHILKNPYRRKLSGDEVGDLIQRHKPVGIIAGIEPLTRKIMEKAHFLKVISRCGIGLDSVDLRAAAELGIKVMNTPDAPTPAVAELTIALMLAVLRKICLMDRSIRNGKWERPMGALLAGKTVGIIGCGRIGAYVARLASSFGCNVLGCDPYIKVHTANSKDAAGPEALALPSLPETNKGKAAASLPRCLNSFCALCDLDTLLRDSDVITLHIPYTRENHHIISRERIFAMKKGAVLINTARGGLIDEEALYDALVKKHLSGAALDCFEKEPYSGPFAELGNVVLTSHVGSNAREARMVMEQQALDNLIKAWAEANTNA